MGGLRLYLREEIVIFLKRERMIVWWALITDERRWMYFHGGMLNSIMRIVRIGVMNRIHVGFDNLEGCW